MDTTLQLEEDTSDQLSHSLLTSRDKMVHLTSGKPTDMVNIITTMLYTFAPNELVTQLRGLTWKEVLSSLHQQQNSGLDNGVGEKVEEGSLLTDDNSSHQPNSTIDEQTTEVNDISNIELTSVGQMTRLEFAWRLSNLPASGAILLMLRSPAEEQIGDEDVPLKSTIGKCDDHNELDAATNEEQRKTRKMKSPTQRQGCGSSFHSNHPLMSTASTKNHPLCSAHVTLFQKKEDVWIWKCEELFVFNSSTLNNTRRISCTLGNLVNDWCKYFMPVIDVEFNLVATPTKVAVSRDVYQMLNSCKASNNAPSVQNTSTLITELSVEDHVLLDKPHDTSIVKTVTNSFGMFTSTEDIENFCNRSKMIAASLLVNGEGGIKSSRRRKRNQHQQQQHSQPEDSIDILRANRDSNGNSTIRTSLIDALVRHSAINSATVFSLKFDDSDLNSLSETMSAEDLQYLMFFNDHITSSTGRSNGEDNTSQWKEFADFAKTSSLFTSLSPSQSTNNNKNDILKHTVYRTLSTLFNCRVLGSWLHWLGDEKNLESARTLSSATATIQQEQHKPYYSKRVHWMNVPTHPSTDMVMGIDDHASSSFGIIRVLRIYSLASWLLYFKACETRKSSVNCRLMVNMHLEEKTSLTPSPHAPLNTDTASVDDQNATLAHIDLDTDRKMDEISTIVPGGSVLDSTLLQIVVNASKRKCPPHDLFYHRDHHAAVTMTMSEQQETHSPFLVDQQSSMRARTLDLLLLNEQFCLLEERSPVVLFVSTPKFVCDGPRSLAFESSQSSSLSVPTKRKKRKFACRERSEFEIVESQTTPFELSSSSSSHSTFRSHSASSSTLFKRLKTAEDGKFINLYDSKVDSSEENSCATEEREEKESHNDDHDADLNSIASGNGEKKGLLAKRKNAKGVNRATMSCPSIRRKKNTTESAVVLDLVKKWMQSKLNLIDSKDHDGDDDGSLSTRISHSDSSLKFSYIRPMGHSCMIPRSQFAWSNDYSLLQNNMDVGIAEEVGVHRSENDSRNANFYQPFHIDTASAQLMICDDAFYEQQLSSPSSSSLSTSSSPTGHNSSSDETLPIANTSTFEDPKIVIETFEKMSSHYHRLETGEVEQEDTTVSHHVFSLDETTHRMSVHSSSIENVQPSSEVCCSSKGEHHRSDFLRASVDTKYLRVDHDEEEEEEKEDSTIISICSDQLSKDRTTPFDQEDLVSPKRMDGWYL